LLYRPARRLGVIIAGAPAAGKGTQCEYIKKEFGLAHISTGDLLRDEVKRGTPLGLNAKSYMDKGGLVPDDIVIGMVNARMALPGKRFPRLAAVWKGVTRRRLFCNRL
jgi:adenylate kinase